MLFHSIMLTLTLFSFSHSEALAHEENPIEKQIRQNIDNICGGQGCEREHSYLFDTLIIKGTTGLLYYNQLETIWVRDDNNIYNKEVIKYRKAVCPFSLIPEDNLQELTKETLNQITDCLLDPIIIEEHPKY